MPLTNKQYDAIMRIYDRRQYRNYRTQCARREEILQKIPDIGRIEAEITAKSLQHAEQLYDVQGADPKAEQKQILSSLQQELLLLRAEKERLLQKAGYPADYMEMPCTCPDCRDTGYVGRRKCRCFQREEIRLLYSSSRLEDILAKENFSTLSMEVYDEEQRAAMPGILNVCRDFVDTFADSFKNLHFYGPVGTGKTFLSNCIAKELLDQGYSVVYFTSFQFFEQFSGFGNGEPGGRTAYQEPLLESDLLILDDLGTELANTFTVSRLFQILNERALRRRSTILSTNLSPKDFRDIYSERVFSRITSSYTLVKFTGSDIRIRKKIARSRQNPLTMSGER